jgi:hypothetical protein
MIQMFHYHNNDYNFEQPLEVVTTHKRKKKNMANNVTTSANKMSCMLTENKDIWDHDPEIMKAQMPVFKKSKYNAKKE